jgi:hypothetical protein
MTLPFSIYINFYILRAYAYIYMTPTVQTTIKDLLNEKLILIEQQLNVNVFSYTGQIGDGLEHSILQLIEELAADAPNKKDRLLVILTTTGAVQLQ